jgi:hypothetical protein
MINYDIYMSYKRVLARWLHKRMAHLYTQASVMAPYTISLKRILQDSGIVAHKRFRYNIKRVEEALDEMVEKKQVLRYQTHAVYDANRKNKITDALFEVFPGAEFVAEMKKANARRRNISTK